MTDKLQALFSRALKRAEDRAALSVSRAQHSALRTISEDYAARLQDKSVYRRLLNDEPLDAVRFRWYFTRIENSIPLDELRKWIDGKIAKEK